METHAHHLHKAPSHGWKHYFFEFLMLFLAVTLGFFVENQREHYVEHQRANEFAKSLVHDLQTDMSSIDIQKKSSQLFVAISDSLLVLSNGKLEGRNAAM